MQDIKQCKECGHENPKKFMGKEYTSHTPNCPQDIKQITDDWSKQAKELSECKDIKQIAKKEFLEPEIGVYWNTTAEESVDFWFKVISLAVEQEKERCSNATHTATPSMDSTNYSDSVTELECFQDGFDDACQVIRSIINNK